MLRSRCLDDLEIFRSFFAKLISHSGLKLMESMELTLPRSSQRLDVPSVENHVPTIGYSLQYLWPDFSLVRKVILKKPMFASQQGSNNDQKTSKIIKKTSNSHHKVIKPPQSKIKRKTSKHVYIPTKSSNILPKILQKSSEKSQCCGLFGSHRLHHQLRLRPCAANGGAVGGHSAAATGAA